MLEVCFNSSLEKYMLKKNLVKEKTCFKNFSSPSCMDLFLANVLSYQHIKTSFIDKVSQVPMCRKCPRILGVP